MRAEFQQAISPPTVQQPVRPMDVKDDPTQAVAAGASAKVDFLSVLGNSNTQVTRDRQAKANGTSLAGAESYDDFLRKMNDATTKQREPKNNLDKDDFLHLFVTQLQNQDPLNPEDSSEMASRLAQFNSLEQMLNVNTTLDKMLTSQEAGRNSNLISYIGKEVMIEDGRFRVKDSKVENGLFELESAANQVTLEVRDDSGTVVGRTELGSMPRGSHSIKWDPKDMKGAAINDGIYTFALTAKGMDDSDVKVQVKSQARITGLDLKNPKGELYTDLGRVQFDKMSHVGETGFDAHKKALIKKDQVSKVGQPAAATPPGSDAPPVVNAAPESKDQQPQNQTENQSQGQPQGQARGAAQPTQPTQDMIAQAMREIAQAK